MVIRNLEVIGEAARRVSPVLRVTLPDLDWRRICGTRDVLSHGYIVVDIEEVWTVAAEHSPEVQAASPSCSTPGTYPPRRYEAPDRTRAIFNNNQCIRDYLLWCIGIT